MIHTRKNGRLLVAAAIAAVGAPLAYLGIGAADVVPAIVLITVAYGTLNAYYGLGLLSDSGYRRAGNARHRDGNLLHGDVHVRRLFRPTADRPAQRSDGTSRGGGGRATAITEAFKAIGLQQAMFIIPVLSLLLALVLYAGREPSPQTCGSGKHPPPPRASCGLKNQGIDWPGGGYQRMADRLAGVYRRVRHTHRRPAVDPRRPERARLESPFGDTVAHGFLTVALLSRLVSQAVNLELNRNCA